MATKGVAEEMVASNEAIEGSVVLEIREASRGDVAPREVTSRDGNPEV